jgi:hypothetical protein
MGIFVDYPVNPFSGLTNTPVTILATGSGANLHPLQVNSITVCNIGTQDIRFNLKRSRTGDTNIETFIIKQFEIKAYETVDVLARLGLQIFLEYIPGIFPDPPLLVDSLICYSNGYTQIFDCEVNYTRLNDLPLPPP